MCISTNHVVGISMRSVNTGSEYNRILFSKKRMIDNKKHMCAAVKLSAIINRSYKRGPKLE